MLELQHIHKYYNPGTVNEMCLFEDFNLSIKKGQFVSVVGSNGSGKTSMLNIVCGSINPDSGKILIEGQDITKEKEYRRLRRIGRVYQNPAMGTCPNMTILENMSMADHKGKFFGLSMGTNKSRIPFYQEQLRQLNLGLEDKLQVKVGSLSGGQEVLTMIGFLDGINESLLIEQDLDAVEEDTVVSLAFDKERLYKNMVAAKADWLYELPQWKEIFSEEELKKFYKEQKESTTIRKPKKIGRNDPCPCGSGKKYKKCCGR